LAKLFVTVIFILSQSYAFAASESPELNLDDLGFNKMELQPNPELQNTLNERSGKLQTHQKLGLLTLALAAATVITAEEGKKAPESHENLGLVTGVSYFTTAYFSLTAPDDPGAANKKSALNMKVHRAMAFIHFPAMLLLPFAGESASHSYQDGKPLTGLGKQKKRLAGAAVASMAIAAISVSFDF
jgi:hypothetical protein